jgi:hypothetical protein
VTDLLGMTMDEVVALMDGHHPPPTPGPQLDGYWNVFCSRAEATIDERYGMCVFLLGMPSAYVEWQTDYARRQAKAAKEARQ